MISRFNKSTNNNILFFCIIYQLLLTLFIRSWSKAILNSVPYFVTLRQEIDLHFSFPKCIIIFIEQRYTILVMIHDLLSAVKLLLKEPIFDTNCWKYWEGGESVFLTISIIINLLENYLIFNYYQCLYNDSSKQKEHKCTYFLRWRPTSGQKPPNSFLIIDRKSVV